MSGKPLTTVVDELPSWHSKGGGFSSAALGHRPQKRAKGADPRTGTPLRRNVFLPWCPVSSLSWPASAGAFLVPDRWFCGPAPSGSSLFLFRLMFLSTGRGRHVPAPGGRDVGSSAGAPTQEPAQGADPRTGFFRYHLCTTFLRTSLCLTCSFPCTLLFIFRVCFLQWLSSTPAVPYSVVQDKSSSLLRILSLSWRSTGCFGWRKTLSMVSPFTLQGYRATCVSLVVLVKALVKLWISRGVIDLCRSLVFYTGFFYCWTADGRFLLAR